MALNDHSLGNIDDPNSGLGGEYQWPLTSLLEYLFCDVREENSRYVMQAWQDSPPEADEPTAQNLHVQ